jgi:type IV pilus assembly protein PilO
MTNLQQGASILSPRGLRRLWFGAPAAALGVLSLVMAAAVLLPLWQTLQRDNRRLRELEDLQVQVSLVRQQLRAQDLQQEKALQQRDKLLRMISGSGDVSTLLAVLDREAKEAGVRLDLYEPQAGGPPPPAQAAPAPSGGGNPNQQPPPNPLETAGLQPQGMLISLRGRYPNLLNFLRRLESLNLLVIQSDLKLEAPPASTDPKKPAAQEVSMKLSLRVYGKPGGGEAQASPAAPGTTPPATPPAAPGAPGTAAPGAATPSNPANPAPPAPATQPGSPPATPPAQPAQGGAPPATPQGSTAPPAANPPAAPRPAGR